MINVIATYTVKPDFAEQNKNNIQNFLKDFQELEQDDFSYTVFVKDDGATFVHQSVYENEEIQNKLLSIPSFKEFQKQRDDNAIPGSHKVEVVTLVGQSGKLVNKIENNGKPRFITLSFERKINAPAEKVWDILWSEDTYGEWTKYFSPGSSMQSDWKVNGKTYFTDASKKNGMASTITRLEQPTSVVFQHLGFLKDGEEDLDSDDARSFSGALENYHLTEEDGVTTLIGSLEISSQYEQDMKDGFEKGFDEVKRLAENDA